MVGIFLLWPMVDDDTGICEGPVLRDLANVIVREEKDGVSGLCDAGLPLGKTVEFLAHCWYPEVFQVGVVLEFPVLCNGLFGDGMDNAETAVFNFNMGASHCNWVDTLAALSCMTW